MTLRNILESVVGYDGFKHHRLYNITSVLEFIDDIKNNPDSKLMIDVDYDPDGVIAGVQIFDTVKEVGIENVTVHIPKSKRHGIDDDVIHELQDNGFTHLIILDSSTNEMDMLRKISDLGVKVLIIDHHVPDYTISEYPENVLIINNKLCEEDKEVRELSAGFLTYLVTEDIRKHFNLSRSKFNFVWGYITLISDSCELSEEYIKPIILDISKYEPYIPRQVKLFMGIYDELNRSFVSYRFINRINSVFRSNRSDLIRKLFFELDELESYEIQALKAEIDDIYSTISDKVKRFTEHLHNFVKDLGSFIAVDMSKAISKTTLSTDYLVNATGQFAGNLSREYNKPCLCLMPQDKHVYKCSMRDGTGLIDLYEVGEKFNLNGGGHRGAYGFTIPRYDLDELEMLLSTLSLDNTSDSLIDCDSLSYVEFKHMVNQVAMYNEVAGNRLCKLKLKRTLNSSFIAEDIGSLRVFSMRDVQLKDFKQVHTVGSVVELEPVYSRKPYCIIN